MTCPGQEWRGQNLNSGLSDSKSEAEQVWKRKQGAEFGEMSGVKRDCSRTICSFVKYSLKSSSSCHSRSEGAGVQGRWHLSGQEVNQESSHTDEECAGEAAELETRRGDTGIVITSPHL